MDRDADNPEKVREYTKKIASSSQHLLGLLSNAVKYTPYGGQVTLTVQELPQLSKQLARFRFVVADNGYGMTEEYLRTIFQAFTREEDSVTNKIQGADWAWRSPKTWWI